MSDFESWLRIVLCRAVWLEFLYKQRSLFFAVSIWLTVGMIVLADSRKESFTIEKEVKLFDDTRRVEIDLGELPTGVTGQVSIKLLNQSSAEREFNHVRASCNCVHAEIAPKTMAPDESIALSLRLNTVPASNLSSPTFAVAILLLAKEGGLQINLKYRLRGMLAFPRSLYSPVLSTKLGPTIVRIPFYATDPVDPVHCRTSIQAESVGNARIESDPSAPDSWFLVIDVDGSKLPKSGLTTSIKLEDPQTGKMAQTSLVLTVKPPVRVSPRSVRFIVDSERPERLEANCIIEVQPPSRKPEISAVDKRPSRGILVDAVLEGKRLSAKVTSMRKNYYRCKLSCPVEFMESILNTRVERDDGPLEIHWEISADGKRMMVQSRVSISRSSLYHALDTLSGGEK